MNDFFYNRSSTTFHRVNIEDQSPCRDNQAFAFVFSHCWKHHHEEVVHTTSPVEVVWGGRPLGTFGEALTLCSYLGAWGTYSECRQAFSLVYRIKPHGVRTSTIYKSSRKLEIHSKNSTEAYRYIKNTTSNRHYETVHWHGLTNCASSWAKEWLTPSQTFNHPWETIRCRNNAPAPSSPAQGSIIDDKSIEKSVDE